MRLDTGNTSSNDTTVNYNCFYTASLQNSSDLVFTYHVVSLTVSFIKTKA